MRRIEQPIDQPFIGLLRLVSQVGGHVFRSRRQPSQVIRDAAQPGRSLCRPHRRKSLVLQFGQNEGVDRIAHPGGILDPWLGRPMHRLIGPEGPALGSHAAGNRSSRGRSGSFGDRRAPGNLFGYPASEDRNVLVGELPLGGHFQSILITDGLEQPAAGGFVGSTAGPESPPFKMSSRLVSRKPPRILASPP